VTSAGPQLTPPIRLLVVEDDPGTSDVIRTELTLAGYAVTTSDHPDGALDMVSQNRVDLVLLGLDRPRLNSLDLLARIKNAAPGTPVLMLGDADGTAEACARALELGADDFLEAPFHPTIVRTRVKNALDRRALNATRDSGLQKLQQLSHDLRDLILPIAVSLSTEKDTDRLLERILLEAKNLCHADAATLYVRTKDDV
jgi:DNA-binding response OmpR family regulator